MGQRVVHIAGQHRQGHHETGQKELCFHDSKVRAPAINKEE